MSIDHRSYAHTLSSCEIKAWKSSGLKGVQTHDLCNTGAALYQLSFQAIWELAIVFFTIYGFELTKWPALRWLDSSVGRVLHQSYI